MLCKIYIFFWEIIYFPNFILSFDISHLENKKRSSVPIGIHYFDE